MSRGIDQPGGVETKNGAKEDAPEQKAPSSQSKNYGAKSGDGNPVPPAYPGMEFVFAKFRNVSQELIRIVVQGLAGEDPAHVGPESPVMRRVRVTISIR